MRYRLNLREIGELFEGEAQAFHRRYGEHLGQLEATHVKRTKARTETEKTLSGLRETEQMGNQMSQA